MNSLTFFPCRKIQLATELLWLNEKLTNVYQSISGGYQHDKKVFLEAISQVMLQFVRSQGHITLFQTCFLPYHRLGERSDQCEEEGHQPPAPVNGGVHHVPRMHCVGGDTVG